MHPVLFQWGSLKVYSYGFFVALGILAAVLVFSRNLRDKGHPRGTALDLAVVSSLAGLLGARLAYVLLYNPGFYWQHPWRVFLISEGGLAFYGGLVFGLAAALFYLWKQKLPVLEVLDEGAPALALGYAAARLGCFLNGCCYGKPTTLPWGVVFPAVDWLPRHPTQLYSLMSGLLIFFVLQFLLRPRREAPGRLFAAFLVLYGLTRGAVELFRENPAFSTPLVPVLFSLLLALLGAGAWVYFGARS